MTATDPLPQLVAVLTADEMPRVWSLLVTIFGDLVQPDGGPISGRTLGRITAAIGIRPEATRVALHRLRKDGWIRTEKRGRESLYRLAPLGQKESRAAWERIYGPAPQLQSYWLVVTDPALSVRPAGLVPVSEDLALGSAPLDDRLVRVALPSPLPDWMRQRLCSEDLVQASSRTKAALEYLAKSLPDAQEQTAIARAVLRVLVVHRWRRVTLRAPHLPDELLPEDWAGAECRRLSHALLETLPRPAIADLDRVEDMAG